MYGILAVVLGLGLMILVHEFGHFIVARFFGVRVDVFSIGLGPRLWGVKRGATDYRLSAVPVGGYVRMAGENPSDERTGAADEFLSKKRWQRMFIVLAGPTTNLLLAVALTAGLFMYAFPQPAYLDTPVVVAGVLKDSPAAAAGIQAGDRIVSLAGAETPTWERALELASSAPAGSEAVVVERQGQRVSLSVKSDAEPIAVLGYPAEPVLVGATVSGGAAEGAGLLPGDEIVAANGHPMISPNQFSEFIQQSAGQPVELEIARNSRRQKIDLTPTWGDAQDSGKPRWLIGISFDFATVKRSYSLPVAVVKSSEFHLLFGGKMLQMIGQLFTGRASMKQLQGPLGIVQESSRQARKGFAYLITFMAIVSLNLGVLNLLPIPILDGGHIVMLAIEGALRKDLSLKVKERILTTGMVLLLAVFLFVTFNDITRMLGLKM